MSSDDPAYGEHVVPPVESVEHEQHDRPQHPQRQQNRAPRDRALKHPRRDR